MRSSPPPRRRRRRRSSSSSSTASDPYPTRNPSLSSSSSSSSAVAFLLALLLLLAGSAVGLQHQRRRSVIVVGPPTSSTGGGLHRHRAGSSSSHSSPPPPRPFARPPVPSSPFERHPLGSRLRRGRGRGDRLPPLRAIPPSLPVFDALSLDRSAMIFPSLPSTLSMPESVTPGLFLSGLLGSVTGLSMSSLAPAFVSAMNLELILDVLPFAFGAVLYGALYELSHPPEGYRSGAEPYPRGEYDPVTASAYYSKRPLLVVRRSIELLRISNAFLLGLTLDRCAGTEATNRPRRAAELLDLIQRAGPAAVKVGQALSVRPDLIPYEYANALSTLQDRVPPFDSDRAREILIDELGQSKVGRFEGLRGSFEGGPVASASIGQVYRASVRFEDGRTGDVAIKVQRPDALSEIALDLHLVREVVAPAYRKFTRTATDLQALANEWGRGFVAELDYRTEAENTGLFNAEMTERELNAVFAPEVVEELSSGRILTTRWVEGRRLDESDADDVPRLCGVALNSYLVMLLEIGTLHCDPHPGNLLRTADGRLCILDWGMTIQTDPKLQYCLLEFVAHLTGENYAEVSTDLVKLGFLKEERLDTVRASGFLEPLTYMLRQAREGGGGTKVRERIFDEYRSKYPGLEDDELRIRMRADMKETMREARERESAVSGITMEVEELQRKNRDAFGIPEWFLYTSRAFLTLEGISLQADEDYSIIQSCFPYVARRLLSDNSERSQRALRDLLYGAGDSIDVTRLTDLADGFSTYTTSTKTVNGKRRLDAAPAANGKEAPSGSGLVPANGDTSERRREKRLGDAEAAATLARDSADIILNPDGIVQDLLVEEGTRAASAAAKDALRVAAVETPRRIREALPLGLGSLLPPVPFENEILEPLLRKTTDEERAQALAEKLASGVKPPRPPKLPQLSGVVLDEAGGGAKGASSGGGIRSADFLRDAELEEVAFVAKQLRENLPKYAPLAGQLGGKFASKLLERAGANIEHALTEWDGEEDSPERRMLREVSRGLSSAANLGANAINGQMDVSKKEEESKRS